MNTAKPLVSIFICTYNQEDFVEETLESFLNQKCNFDSEIVIAEDCSKDNTAAICEDYVRKYPDKIVLLKREKNLGLIKNFFEGITHCRGKYIAMCGGDDYWTDDSKLQKQFEFLEKNPDFVISYTDSIMLDEDGNMISDTEVGYENRRDFTSDELKKGAFLSARTMVFRNIIDYSKTNFKKIFNEDIFLISILGQYGKGKYLEDIKPSVYRILNNGIWSSRNEIQRLKAQILTIKGLVDYYKFKDDEYYMYFVNRHHKLNFRIFNIAIQNNDTKEVLKLYFKALFDFKFFGTNLNFIKLNKTILKYFFLKKNNI